MSKTSAQQWAKRVGRWQRSGLTAREFGQRHGIDPRQLSWWKWQLKKRGELEEDLSTAEERCAAPLEDSVAIRLLPVHVVPDGAAGAEPPRCAVVEVGLRNGRVVRVAQDADLRWLAELLVVVEASGGAGC